MVPSNESKRGVNPTHRAPARHRRGETPQGGNSTRGNPPANRTYMGVISWNEFQCWWHNKLPYTAISIYNYGSQCARAHASSSSSSSYYYYYYYYYCYYHHYYYYSYNYHHYYYDYDYDY